MLFLKWSKKSNRLLAVNCLIWSRSTIIDQSSHLCDLLGSLDQVLNQWSDLDHFFTDFDRKWSKEFRSFISLALNYIKVFPFQRRIFLQYYDRVFFNVTKYTRKNISAVEEKFVHKRQMKMNKIIEKWSKIDKDLKRS